MRERARHPPRRAPPTATRGAEALARARDRSAAARTSAPTPVTSAAGRSHSPPRSPRGARRTSSERAVRGSATRARERRPAGGRPPPRGRELARRAPPRAPRSAPRRAASRSAGAGLRQTSRAELHERLVRSRRADPAGRALPRAPSSVRCASRARRDRPPREEPREHARDVPVHGRRAGSAKAMLATAPAVYGPKPGSARSASSDAGSPPWRASAARAAARRFRHARVVAEAAPEREDLVVLRGRERLERGEPREEALVVRDDRRDLRLLQHHLRDPDAVRVRAVLREAPREGARRSASYQARSGAGARRGGGPAGRGTPRSVRGVARAGQKRRGLGRAGDGVPIVESADARTRARSGRRWSRRAIARRGARGSARSRALGTWRRARSTR